MKKMENILMLTFVLLVLGIAGCGGTTPLIVPPSPIEIINLESPYIITGENYVGGVMDFSEEMQSFYGDISLLGGSPLIEGIEKYFESIKKYDSILIIPPTSEGIQEFRDLENKYPSLCPLSCDDLESELDSHSSPLFYFSQDIEIDEIRGVIVIKELYSGLAGLLSDGVPLNVYFRYENQQLLILE